jgi:uncharacterized protein with beta-barrel porin domain
MSQKRQPARLYSRSKPRKHPRASLLAKGKLGRKAFGENVKVRLSAEWIRRYDHDAAPPTATDITSTLALALPTPDPVRDQARVGVDVDYALDKRTTLSLTVHASGRGKSPDVSGAISLRRSF